MLGRTLSHIAAQNDMKNKATFTILAALAISSMPFVTACDGSSTIVGIHMTNPETITVCYGNFSYEGIGVTVDFRNGDHTEIPLTEDMVPEVERLKFFKIGEQNIEIVYRGRFTTTMPVTVTLNQFKDSYALVGYECVYDGVPHAVGLNQELPEGAVIAYPYGNVFTNAGVYEVVGVMSKNGYESKTLTTTLTIHPAERDASGIVFEDTTVVYNGEMRSITATNVPEGVEVTYDAYDYEQAIRINKVVNAGKYRIVAHFNDTSTNYVKIPDKEAILTIEKADYDISDIKLPDAVKEYDGQDYVAQITNKGRLPTGVTVDYVYYDEQGKKVTSNAKVGYYTIVASFTGGDLANYNPIEPLQAQLSVLKRVIKIKDKVTFEGKTVNFDENVTHSLAVIGTLPDTVKVTYENNDKVYAGEYEVKAKFSAVSENETVDLEELTAYLVINRVRRSVPMYNEATGAYDRPFAASDIKIKDGVVTIAGYQTDVFKLTSVVFSDLLTNETVAPENLVSGTTYKYIVTFDYIDTDIGSSVILSQESDNITYVAE